MTYKLGKAPATPGAVKLKLADYLDLTKLPPLKPKVGWPGVLNGQTIGMLGNDQYGDCVWAGAAHETILWNHMNNQTVPFSDQAVLSDYSAVTGFNPNDPNSDQGTDMAKAAAYRRTTGVVDANGTRHTVAAYLDIEPGNIQQMKYAIYLFGAVGIGIKFPAYAMDQFNSGTGWRVQTANAQIDGGHYIPGIYADTNGFQVITWGTVIRATNEFIHEYCDEAIAYVSYENLNAKGVTKDGFNRAQLLADLQSLPHSS